MFLKRKMNDSTNSYSDKILQIKEKIQEADAVVIGAGAGFSTSVGFVYNGERFEKYFSDFRKKFPEAKSVRAEDMAMLGKAFVKIASKYGMCMSFGDRYRCL